MTHYPAEVVEAARRVGTTFSEGCDRCAGSDLTLLEDAGLMEQGICDDDFGQDTVEVGDTIWTFNDAGLALCKSLGINP